MEPLWGIDLGGTKLEGVILGNTKGSPKVISRLRIPTEREKGYHHIINRIGHLVELLVEDSGLNPKRIGFGTPGAFDPQTQRMKNCNTTVLNGQTLGVDLEKALGVAVRLANDANCFAVAETLMGSVVKQLPNAQVVFGIIMGTGVGGGIVLNGKAWNGKQGIAGEWGHNFLDVSGGPCYCGKTGCVETILSGPALEQWYTNKSGAVLALPAILERARKGKDTIASATQERLLHFFGKGMANVINILDPDAVVLGGGLGNIEELYTLGKERIKEYLFNPRLETVFLKPKLGDSAGVFGAALL